MLLRTAISDDADRLVLNNVCGQRYIGTDLDKQVEIEIHGTPGNDLGAFLNGPKIVVKGNAQDGTGNTMNDGEIIICGHAGDITGFSSRGGKIFIRDGVGYRTGIHMKEYQGKMPVIVIGETAQDFLGEYMAGGILMLLGLNLQADEPFILNYGGTGMHGGTIYLRGDVEESCLGREVGIADLEPNDFNNVEQYVRQFADHFGYDAGYILDHKFIKLFPRYLRPYGRLYAY
jgi:glutamate synthase domain-containing protein 3